MTVFKLAAISVYLVLFLSGVLGLSREKHEWLQWKLRHGKTYKNVHAEQHHLEIWMENYRYVQEHNSRSDVAFRVELNSLADQRLSDKKKLIHKAQSLVEEPRDLGFAPKSWDWRLKGVVSPVTNMGLYYDALAIVSAECVESFHAIHTGKLASVSNMEVHDCCTRPPVNVTSVFPCIHGIGGLCSLAAYPQSMGRCGNDTCSPLAQINGGKEVPAENEVAMTEAVYQTPVMALLDASHISFQLYQEGIYDEQNCKVNQPDHALQVVGYGTAAGGQDYWICKNNWGVSWGEDGYIRIARNKGNLCGIASNTTYPV